MGNRQFHIIALAFVVLGIITMPSCENVVTIDLDPGDPQLVAFCLLQNGESPRVHLTHSIGATQGGLITPVPDASVSINSPNQSIGNFVYSETDIATWSDEFNGNTVIDGLYHLDIDATVAWQAGEEYNLEISAPGYETITANTNFPTIVPIENIDTSWYNGKFDIFSDADDVGFYLKVDITISDPPNEKNYYTLVAKAQGDYGNDKLPVSGNDIKLGQYEYVGKKIYFTDNLFDGETVTLSFLVDAALLAFYEDPYYPQNGDRALSLRLRMPNKDWYDYQYTRNRQANVSGPFSEPIIMHDNIDGGNGIFAAEEFYFETIIFE